MGVTWNDEFILSWRGEHTHLNWWGRRLQPECLYTSLPEQVGIDGQWEPPWSCRCWSMLSRGCHVLYTRQRCLPATLPLSGLAACSWWPASHQRSHLSHSILTACAKYSILRCAKKTFLDSSSPLLLEGPTPDGLLHHLFPDPKPKPHVYCIIIKSSC